MKAGRWSLVVSVSVLGGCAITDLWSGGPRELSRTRTDVTEMRCNDARSFGMRVTADGKSAWVVLPDREFRLDAVAGVAGRYTNGRTTLNVQGGEATLEETGNPAWTGCKRPAAA